MTKNTLKSFMFTEPTLQRKLEGIYQSENNVKIFRTSKEINKK